MYRWDLADAEACENAAKHRPCGQILSGDSSTMYTMAMMKHSSEETRRCRSVILLFCIGIAPNSRPEARQIMPSTTAMAMDSGEVINIPFVT